jgi:plasmid stabilization system protein ParE
MAEIVGLVATSVGVAVRLIKTGEALYRQFRDGPKELRAMILETAALESQLNHVHLFASDSDASYTNAIMLQVEHAQQTMQELQQLLDTAAADTAVRRRGAALKLRDAMTQLLRKPEVGQKLKELHSCRESLTFAIVADTRYVFRSASSSALLIISREAVKEIAAGVAIIQDKLEGKYPARYLKSGN